MQHAATDDTITCHPGVTGYAGGKFSACCLVLTSQLEIKTSFRLGAVLKDCQFINRTVLTTDSWHNSECQGMKQSTHICCIWGFDSIDVACNHQQSDKVL